MNSPKKLITSLSLVILMLFLLTGFAYAEGSRLGTITGDGVNVRKSPELSASIVTQMAKGTKVSIIDDTKGWFKVKYEDITGWISADFISVKDTALGTGVITGTNVNVRSEPSTDANIITKLDKGTRLEYYKRSGDWYSIKLEDGKFGWVMKDYFQLRDTETSRGVTEDFEPGEDSDDTVTESDISGGAQEIIAYAKKLIGVRYVYGGSSPKGFDCSGFTSYVFKHFGISLDRTSSGQAGSGSKVSRSQLRPADLVFFDTNGGMNSIEHVGIYIGGGKFIHASSGRDAHRVIISSLNDGYYDSHYMRARRYIE